MYRTVTGLLQPTVLLYLLLGLALVNLWRKRVGSRRPLLWVTIPFCLLAVLCMPAVSYLLLGSLEWSYPPLEQRPSDTEAIVVLSGYICPTGELGGDTLRRCRKALELYRQGKPCPVLVSGGKVNPDAPGPTLAAAMRAFLVREGVSAADVIVEERSSTTHENAVESCQLLREQRIQRIVLVTDATHLQRALGCFRKQGYEAVPCGCRYRARTFQPSVLEFLPNPAAAGGTEVALHEWLGIAWYWWCGRL